MTVEKVWYNSMYFDNVKELVAKYDLGAVDKIKVTHSIDSDLYSTFIPQGHINTPTDIHGPKLVEPQGPRYHIDQNFVKYAGWSFPMEFNPQMEFMFLISVLMLKGLLMRSAFKKLLPFMLVILLLHANKVHRFWLGNGCLNT